MLALRVRCQSPTRHDVAATLTALADRYDGCFVFGYQLGDASWVGASPELLVSLEKGRVRALSLAGTSARGESIDEDDELGGALIASAKERSEHDLVVRATREALSSLCRDLSVPDSPRLLRMAGIQHLQTPIEGTAAPGVDLLDALLTMHPTPAVGGSPREPALEAIARLEGMDRGWYAGPIGWMDMNGEGAFAVALRSALLRDREALLYAGAGIVAGSDPDRELAEAELKLHPLLEALRGGVGVIAAANTAAARALVDGLARAGVRDACVTPGSRSTPLTVALAEQSAIRPWLHLDERSSAFFALGLARASGRPVALVCTSGTAAVNFHPAVVEADLSRVPLIVCTADRPLRLRNVGAPQTIDQVGLYGVSVRHERDLPVPGFPDAPPAVFAEAARHAVEVSLGPLPRSRPPQPPLRGAPHRGSLRPPRPHCGDRRRPPSPPSRPSFPSGARSRLPRRH